MRRIVVSTVGAVALAAGVVGVVSNASAAENDKQSGAYTFTVSNICVDPIRVAGSYDEMVHTLYNQDGEAVRMSFTGTVTVTYTDLANGRTFSPNSSGPGTVDLATG